jgi:predicted lipoprotein with Yx(FWY)xxD motif
MTVPRSRPGVVAALAGALLLAACNANAGGGSSAASASAAASGSAVPGTTYQLKVGTTSAGQALTGTDGKTLYFFARDANGTSACTGDCPSTWPPFTLANGATVTAGDGVQSPLIGSITRADGSKQVTYGGHPLYYYGADAAAGDANGEGLLGVWFIADPSGNLPSPSASAAASPSAASSGYSKY